MLSDIPRRHSIRDVLETPVVEIADLVNDVVGYLGVAGEGREVALCDRGWWNGVWHRMACRGSTPSPFLHFSVKVGSRVGETGFWFHCVALETSWALETEQPGLMSQFCLLPVSCEAYKGSKMCYFRAFSTDNKEHSVECGWRTKTLNDYHLKRSLKFATSEPMQQPRNTVKGPEQR